MAGASESMGLSAGQSLGHLRKARRGGWVTWAAGVLESFPSLRALATEDADIAAEVAEVEAWLAWARPHEEEHGESSLLRTDDPEVRAITDAVNPVLAKMGLPAYPTASVRG